MSGLKVYKYQRKTEHQVLEKNIVQDYVKWGKAQYQDDDLYEPLWQ